MNNKENFIGYDPIDGHKIIVLGELKDKIHPKVEIKRGNEKELIEDIGHQITELGYSSYFFNKGNHIAFCNQKNDKDLYVIEWHFDVDYKQENIVKKVCDELNIPQKELATMLGIKPTALSNWANGDVPQLGQKALELLIENIKLKEKFEILKKAHKILSEQ
ncbi:helix-turn-helix domain-containing protein [Aliarcobacter butzleri]|uniref:helix-turn-helix domain-containing protein n=1 Tax=Aliarcobacter butzleri TaxID=28197 RepID=UPI00189F1E6A|nr:helix-turn-helix domain-containing protein [Aliarcobacter butzleri]MBF7065785.1 XRE family transcriptional regulator [Aliarcobacter butzleri]